MPRNVTYSLALVLAALVGGCGGGSDDGNGGDDTPTEPVVPIVDDDDGPVTPIDTGDGFNGPLSGKLLIERRLLDLSTGRYGEDLVDRDLDVTHVLSAAPDGRSFYDIRAGCRERLGFASYDCVVVFDPSGTEIDELDPELELSDNAPTVSADGRFLAVDSTEIHGVQRVAILGPDGAVLDSGERTSTVDRVSFGPDGTMYYLVDGAVFRADVGDDPADDTLVLRFDDADGFPSALAVSPDGARLAVELDTSESTQEQESAVWLLNADGGDLRRFATSTFLPTVRNPIWSPDGRWLLVSSGGFTGSTGGRPTPADGLEGGLLALDTSVPTHDLDNLGLDSTATQIRIRSDCDPADASGCRLDSRTGRLTGAWIP